MYETPHPTAIVDPNEGKKINWMLCMPSVHKLFQVHISVACKRYIEWELILEMVIRSFKIDFNS